MLYPLSYGGSSAAADPGCAATRLAGGPQGAGHGPAEQRLQHDALHDALTGLPNRKHFQRQLEAALRDADRFRFANELRAWIEVEDGRIVDHVDRPTRDSVLETMKRLGD